jgi:hypothetical protein
MAAVPRRDVLECRARREDCLRRFGPELSIMYADTQEGLRLGVWEIAWVLKPESSCRSR